MSKHTKRKKCRSGNNMGSGERWNNFKRRIRNLQPHRFRTRKLKQRIEAARRAELKRDSVVDRDLRNYLEREAATQEGPRVGRKFSELRERRGAVRPARARASQRSALSRISSGVYNEVLDQLANRAVNSVTGLSLPPDHTGCLNLSLPSQDNLGGGVGASVMRGRIETQREDRELLSKFLHDELKRMEARRLKQTKMKKSIEKRRAEEKTRKKKKKKKGKSKPKLERARSGEM